MRLRGTEEDQRADDRRKHELALAKIELQKLIANQPLNEFILGKYAIKWTGITLVTLICNVSICCSIPGQPKPVQPDEVYIRTATMDPVDSDERIEIAKIFARTDSIKAAKGLSYDSQTPSRSADAGKQFRFYEFGPKHSDGSF